MKFGITNLSQSLDNGQNSTERISNFRVSGQFLVNVNCPNSWSSDDIDMKLGTVIKLDKRNKTTSKNLKVTSLPFFQFMANLNQFGSWIPSDQSVKLKFLLTVTSYLTKTENRTKESATQVTLLLWGKVLFLPKTADFLQKTLTSAKIWEPWY